LAGAWRWDDGSSANGSSAFSTSVWQGWQISLAGAASRCFPPEVAVHLVKLACERPDRLGRSLCQWDCVELARQLEREGLVESISPETVRRILEHHKLKPWRHHLWLSPPTPRDTEFYARVAEVVDLYTRSLRTDEIVLCMDEKTSLQPRPRLHTTLPAMPGLPNRVEHEYRRAGAVNLLAAFDTRTGLVYGRCYGRKRQQEVIAFLEYLHAEIPATIRTIHLVCDNARAHHGAQVREWLASHPRVVLHFIPVHCSWLNQVEQWFSILQRKRLRIVDFASTAHLQAKLLQFIAEWNTGAHPFKWTTRSVAKVMAEATPVAA
jgi:transposase